MILVLGYGNPLRGDDGVGQLLARHIAERNHACDVRVIPCFQLTPELAEVVSRARLVIFIDARVGASAGCWTVHRVTPAADVQGGAFTHNVTPESLLAAARELYGSSPDGMVITVEGEVFDYGETVSPAMEAALPIVLEAVEDVIRVECQLLTTEADDHA